MTKTQTSSSHDVCMPWIAQPKDACLVMYAVGPAQSLSDVARLKTFAVFAWLQVTVKQPESVNYLETCLMLCWYTVVSTEVYFQQSIWATAVNSKGI